MEKDLKIMSQLRENSRKSLKEISKNTGIPVSTIFDRIRINEKSKIMRHTTIIDFSKIGYSLKALVAIKTKRESRDELKSFLSIHSIVNNLFLVNNQHDFLAEIVCRNLKELRDFFDQIENRFEITKKDEYLILEDLRREQFMTNNPSLIDS